MNAWTRMCIAVFTIGSLALGLVLPAGAGSMTWTGGGNGTSWNDPANWGGTKPGANDEGVFTTSGTANKTITLDASQSLRQLTVSGNPTMAIGTAADASAGYTLTLGAIARNNYPNSIIPTMTANVVVASSRTTLPCSLDANGSDNISIAGNINGAGKILEVNGGGLLVLSGNNSFSSVTLNGGILQLNSANAIGSAPVVFNGGTLQLFDATDLSGRFSQAPYQYYSFATPSNVTFATPLTSVGGRLSKSGSGTLTLSVANSYSGPTTVSAGTLTFSGAGSLGSATAALTLAGGTLDLGSASPLTAGTVYMTGANPGTIQNGTLNGATYLPTFTGTATINANLGGTGVALSKGNSGTLNLGGANTYTGDTVVNGGGLTLTFNAASAPQYDILNASSALKLSAATVTVNGKATTRNNGQTVNVLTLNPGASSFAIAAGSATNYTRLTLTAITRNAGSTVNFTQPINNTAVSATNGFVTAAANDASGILGGYATVAGTDWAANNGTNIVAYTNYAPITGNTPVITGGVASNVRISNASTNAITLAATGTTTINTLLNKDAAARTNLIGTGNTLRLGAVGGILTPSGTGPWTIDLSGNAGTLTAGGADSTPGDLIFNNATTVTNNAVIADNGSGAVALTKSGSGSLTLGATNTCTGGTFLNAGSLFLPGGVNPLATNGSLTVIGGTLNLGGAVQTGTVVSVQGGAVTNGTLVATATNYDFRAGTVTTILGGNKGLVKTTSGALTLTGATPTRATRLCWKVPSPPGPAAAARSPSPAT